MKPYGLTAVASFFMESRGTGPRAAPVPHFCGIGAWAKLGERRKVKMEGKELKRKIDKVWRSSKKDLDKILKSADLLMRKGEHYLKDRSQKGKEHLEIMALTFQREKFYYELGKIIAKLPKNKWITSKKAQDLISKIKSINVNIGKKKKK